MDANSDGNVTAAEWMDFIAATHKKKGKRGDKWAKTLLHTLRRNITEQDGIRLEAQEVILMP
jgi:hypothetical protein